MKKTIVSLLSAITLIAAANTGKGTFAKACSLPECQNLFTSTLNGLLEDNNVQEAEISYMTEKIYDMDLKELGCLYEFTVNDTQGFAIMIYYEGQFEISEIYLDSENPYKDSQGIKIYPSMSIYLYYMEGVYYDANTNLPYADESVAAISDTAYCGGEAEVVSTGYKVYYSYRTNLDDNSYLLCAQHPDYIGVSGFTNICVAIAAGNIIGYWDRYNPNLISDFEPGELWNGLYFYNSSNIKVDDSIRQLALDMNAGNGTTVAECKSGMTKYCNRAGYSITYTDLMSGNIFTGKSFNYSSAKNKLQSGEPVMIFSEGFSAYEISPNEEEGYDTYIGITCEGNHAMAGFGYLDIVYTMSDGSTNNANFIRVATGQSLRREGYYNIRTHKINDAMSIKIS